MKHHRTCPQPNYLVSEVKTPASIKYLKLLSQALARTRTQPKIPFMEGKNSNPNNTGSITSSRAEQKVNNIVTLAKIMITFCMLSEFRILLDNLLFC